MKDVGDREKIKQVMRCEVTIDKQVVTDRLDKWECHSGYLHEANIEEMVNQILTIPELAVVDREAELPPIRVNHPLEETGYRWAQEDILKEGWVKEIK